MRNFNCTECDRAFESKASLNNHKYRYHPKKKNSSTIAVLDPVKDDQLDKNLEIPSQANTVVDENKMMAHILNLSDSDSDSDSPIFPDDNTNTSNKRTRTPNSSDDEPSPKVPRKISTDSSDDEGSVDVQILRKKKLIKKRERVPDSSDEEPSPKVQRKISTDSSDNEGSVDVRIKHVKKRERVPDSSDDEPTPKIHRKSHTSTDSSDCGVIDVEQQLFDTEQKIKRSKKVSRKKTGQSESGINNEKIRKLQKLEKNLLEKKIVINEDRYARDCAEMDFDIRERDAKIVEEEEYITFLQYSLKKEMKRSKLLIAQLRSVKEDNPKSTRPITRIIENRVTINQINSLRHLLKSGHLEPIIYDHEMIETIQNLLVGLDEGVIPITNVQKLSFTPEHKAYMNKLLEMSHFEAGPYIRNNPDLFVEIFDIVDQSLKLLCKSYLKFDAFGNDSVDNDNVDSDSVDNDSIQEE